MKYTYKEILEKRDLFEKQIEQLINDFKAENDLGFIWKVIDDNVVKIKMEIKFENLTSLEGIK